MQVFLVQNKTDPKNKNDIKIIRKDIKSTV
jgi:hypothetical protein